MQRTGRARVDARHPQAFAVCQRCGFWINHVDGRWQHVAPRYSLSSHVVFNKPIIYPPDPVPIQYAFPENFETANNGSSFPPPLPWPVQAVGPAVASPPTPAYPVYETPPLPPLPEDIEGEP